MSSCSRDVKPSVDELALAARQVLATLAELGAQDALLDVGILGHGTHPRLSLTAYAAPGHPDTLCE